MVLTCKNDRYCSTFSLYFASLDCRADYSIFKFCEGNWYWCSMRSMMPGGTAALIRSVLSYHTDLPVTSGPSEGTSRHNRSLPKKNMTTNVADKRLISLSASAKKSLNENQCSWLVDYCRNAILCCAWLYYDAMSNFLSTVTTVNAISSTRTLRVPGNELVSF